LLAAALHAVGVRRERLLLSWGTAHEAGQFAAVLSGFQRTVRELREEDDLILLRGCFTLPVGPLGQEATP
jgi:coenzyme F420-reducing hydrogenase delta subunit